MSSVKSVISGKKKRLSARAKAPMSALAKACVENWQNPDLLDQQLAGGMKDLENCELLYAFDPEGRLISSNIEKDRIDTSMRGHDFHGRPYFESNLPYKGIVLSKVYVSRYSGRSCITVLQAVRDANKVVGFIAADFDIDLLPGTETGSDEDRWSQFKGDPAIRGTLFMQERVESKMDRHLDETMDIIRDVMVDHGVFHMKIHFSSSRASFWRMDDPYDYVIFTIDDILEPDFRYTFKRQPLTRRAVANSEDIEKVLSLLKVLRNADETVYLRSASFNIINGMVGLTFSCDGSHYVHFREFLGRDKRFWFGERTAVSG